LTGPPQLGDIHLLIIDLGDAPTVGEGGDLMAWRLRGHYVSSCTCRNLCPCPTSSAPPDNPDGSTNCWGVGVFHIQEGNLNDVDLSGIDAAIFVHYPEIVSNGNWQIGLVIDPSVSDEQASALSEIYSGKQGGPFADMAALVTDFSMQRSEVSYSETAASFGGSSFTYEPLRGQDGNATTVSNAPFGFAPVFEVGATNGTLSVLDHTQPASYGEAADFEYSDQIHEHVRA
jgi:hypothetical protein